MTAPADHTTDGGVPDAFVVVRSSGERTAPLAARLAAQEVGADRVETIREAPFAAALRTACRLGAERGHRWTLCLDADVLLRPGAIVDLLDHAERQTATDPKLAGMSGRVADPLLGQIRVAGQSLYRTECLRMALEIDDFDPRNRRPETHLKRRLAERGRGWSNAGPLMGLHDDEQFFRDIFRKVYVHNLKHARFTGYLARYWSRLAPQDPDKRVALWSLEIARMIAPYAPRPGKRPSENVAIDIRNFARDVDMILIPAGMAEKDPLGDDALDAHEIAARLDRFETAPEFTAEAPFIDAETKSSWVRHLGRWRRESPMGRFLGPLAPVLRQIG